MIEDYIDENRLRCISHITHYLAMLLEMCS
jgi:hypothetical protein